MQTILKAAVATIALAIGTPTYANSIPQDLPITPAPKQFGIADMVIDKPMRLGNDHRACEKYQDLAWCSSSKGGKALTKEIITSYVERTRALMEVDYSMDGDGIEEWKSSYEAVAAGKRFVGDCDGLVFTVLDWMNKDGYDISNTYRAVVGTKSALAPDHFVALVVIDDEIFVFADGTRKGVYPLKEAKWHPYVAARNDTKIWYQFNPNVSIR